MIRAARCRCNVIALGSVARLIEGSAAHLERVVAPAAPHPWGARADGWLEAGEGGRPPQGCGRSGSGQVRRALLVRSGCAGARARAIRRWRRAQSENSDGNAPRAQRPPGLPVLPRQRHPVDRDPPLDEALSLLAAGGLRALGNALDELDESIRADLCNSSVADVQNGPAFGVGPMEGGREHWPSLRVGVSLAVTPS